MRVKLNHLFPTRGIKFYYDNSMILSTTIINGIGTEVAVLKDHEFITKEVCENLFGKIYPTNLQVLRVGLVEWLRLFNHLRKARV